MNIRPRKQKKPRYYSRFYEAAEHQEKAGLFMNKYLIAMVKKNLNYIIDNNEYELLELLYDWLQYHNPNVEIAIECILENIDELTDDFFNELIELLDHYNKTELTLLCVRRIIEREKKERFEL